MYSRLFVAYLITKYNTNLPTFELPKFDLDLFTTPPKKVEYLKANARAPHTLVQIPTFPMVNIASGAVDLNKIKKNLH